jgi:iron complex transport system permease protein
MNDFRLLADQDRQALLTVLRSSSASGAESALQERTPAEARTPPRFTYGWAMVALAVLLAVLSTLGLMYGSVSIPAPVALSVLANWVTGSEIIPVTWRAVYDTIIIETRIPRVILAGTVGATLAATGMTIQAIVRNPLAGPSILGVSNGAATGAVIVMRWGLIGLGAYTLYISAFLGALVTLIIVFWVARTGGQITPTRLVLAGIAMSAVLNAVTSLFVLTSPDPQLASRVLFWTLGGFASAQWKLLPLPVLAMVIGSGLMLLQARRLNLLMAGDESATALGLDVHRFRQSMFILTAALTGVMVAVSGVIGFVGLIVPHIVRFMVGADHRRGLPAVALVGASFTIAADLVARAVISPLELPVGIVTALVGGPFFIWLLRRDARARDR